MITQLRFSNFTTSKDAAESIEDARAGMLAKVYRCIAEREEFGATCHEVEWMLGMLHQTASARVRDLRELGRIKDAGFRRRTASGRTAIVWVATGQ